MLPHVRPLQEIGTVAKFAGLWAVLAGATIGGIVMLKLSINRALWLFGFVQLATILPYIWLSQAGHTLAGLFVVVSGEYPAAISVADRELA